jgi:hypothetical protein
VAKEYCIVTQTGFTGICRRTLTGARKALATEVRSALRKCRRSHGRCSQIGTSREGDVEIRIGGRQGYHLWQRYLISSRGGFYGARRRRRKKRRR